MSASTPWANAVTIAQELSRFNSFEPEGKHEAVNYCAKLLREKTSANVTIYDGDSAEPFLIAHYMPKTPCFKLLLEGHLDVVSGDGMQEPFSAKIIDDVMYGRGVCDMKGGCAAILTAFIEAVKAPNPNCELFLMLSTDEEYAGEEIKKALDKAYLPKLDYALIAEPTTCAVYYAHKGEAWAELEFHGKSAHSSTPQFGKNAVYMATMYIEKLRRFMEKYRDMDDALYGMPTMSVGTISGGSSPNVVPPEAKAVVDIRYLPGQSVEQFESDLNTVMEQCRADWAEFNGTVRITGNWNSMKTDCDTPEFAKVSGAIKAVFGEEVRTGVMTGWGEGGFINGYGIPTLYFGPGDMALAHSPSEHIQVDEICKVAEAYRKIISVIC